jgi:GTP-binding protein
VLVVANKVDTNDRIGLSAEFYSFGLGDVFDLSAANGGGTGDLLDEVVSHLDKNDDDVSEQDGLPRIAVVGRPNVGKSSMINALTNQERNIVTDISGTTRDAIHTRYKAFGQDFLLIDTAGIRKKAKVTEDIEYYSVLRSVRTIENADVCFFMIDAAEGLQKQDLSIYYMIEKNSKGVVVLVNKWDLVEKDQSTMKAFEDQLRKQLAPFNDVPIIFTSTITKQRIHKAVETVMEVFANRTKKIPTSKLNEVMLEIINDNPPPSVKGKYVKIKFVQQLPTHAPAFAFFCNLPQYINDSYARFLENRMREHFNFTGVPLKLFFRKK